MSDKSPQDQAAAFLRKPTTSDRAREILPLVRAERARLGEQQEALNEQALDPLATGEEARERRHQANELGFEVERCERIERELGEKEVALADAEAEAVRQGEYDRARSNRDRVAAAIRSEYPKLVERLIELATSIEESDAEIERVNRQLPREGSRLDGADSVARGAHLNGVASTIKLASNMKLPSIEAASGGYVWPRRSPSMFHG